MESQTVDSSTTYTQLPECRFSRAGYEFIGWNTLPNGNGTWFSDQRLLVGDEIADMTLFAQWRPVEAHKPYTQLEYIHSEGTGDCGLASVNTGFKPDTNMRILLEYSKVDSSANVAGNWKDPNYAVAVSNNKLALFNNAPNYDIDGALNTKITLDAQRYSGLVTATYTVDSSTTNVVIGAENSNDIGNTDLYLFALNKGNEGNAPYSGGGRARIYSAKIWGDDERLVREYIPVILTEDITASQAGDGKAHHAGELGLWDKVESKFYGNANSTGYFTNASVCVIRFDANGGTGTMEAQSVIAGSAATALAKNTFTRTGKTFVGWNTEQDGTGVWYGDEYESNEWKGGDVYELYAQWADEAGTGYFQAVHYMQTGTLGGYIDTLIPGNEVYGADVRFKTVSAPQSEYAVIMGSDFDNFCIGMHGNLTTLYSWWNGKKALWSTAMPDTDSVDARMTGASVTLNGASQTLQNTSAGAVGGTSPTTVRVGSVAGTNDRNMDAKYYGVKLTDSSGEALVHLVPCVLTRKISTYEAAKLASDYAVHLAGEVGMWDLVSNRFYGNVTGIGKFTCELD